MTSLKRHVFVAALIARRAQRTSPAKCLYLTARGNIVNLCPAHATANRQNSTADHMAALVMNLTVVSKK